MKIRKVKNSAGNVSVQIGNYKGKNFILHKHIGSAKTKEDLDYLLKTAQSIIHESQMSLIKEEDTTTFSIDHINPIGYRRNYAYEILSKYYDSIFKVANQLFKDLVVMRIVNPCSKTESIKLLDEYFGIKYKKSTLFDHMTTFDKNSITQCAVEYATTNLSFDFSFVFYDVTTLYFETHKGDEFRKNGFSKDNKINQPQVVVGLVVDKNGFPVDFNVFEGNKFEGHTMLPVIKSFRERNKIAELTVVADAGMLSANNLLELEDLGMKYIVGGRTATFKINILESVFKELDRKDGTTCLRIINDRKCIFHFSLKRYKKDSYELSKHIERAKSIVSSPNKLLKRSKFVKGKSSNLEINKGLIEKYEILAGIKSYVTNLDNTDHQTIIDRYSDLWKVEKAFRISKHDLEARPMYHRKAEKIQSHLLIVFGALAISKVIELEKRMSIRYFLNSIIKVIDFKFEDSITKKIFTIRSSPH